MSRAIAPSGTRGGDGFAPAAGGWRSSPSKPSLPIGWPIILFVFAVLVLMALTPIAERLSERWYAKSFNDLPGANAAPASASVAPSTPPTAAQSDDSPYGPFDNTALPAPRPQAHSGAPIIIMHPVVQMPVYQPFVIRPTPHQIFVPGRRLPNGIYMPGYWRTVY
jgi:hypothetical protein